MALTIMSKYHLQPYDRLSPTRHRTELSGKTMLITGGGYGTGAAIASAFAAAGIARIILIGRTESKLRATTSSLQEQYVRIRFSYKIVDIASSDSVRALFSEQSFYIDILVNNAGFLPTPDSFVSADLVEWWRGFEINLLGTALVTQGFLQNRRVQKAGNTGIVLNLNTIGTHSVMVPNLSAYGASKAALLRLNELLSADVPKSEARFISIHPGAVKTDMGIKSGLDGVFPETDARLAAEFVVWASSDEAAFLAGRFAWVNWDIDELLEMREKTLSDDLLRSSLKE